MDEGWGLVTSSLLWLRYAAADSGESSMSADTSSRPQGIVRESKRPAGWTAPGPPPAGPGDDPTLWPEVGEDLCFLSGDWRIFQRIDGHRWSLDDLLTAWYGVTHAPARVERALDLGCGIGSVLMMIGWSFPEATLLGIEAQDVSQALARRSIAYNGAADRITVRHGDLREEDNLPEGNIFDLVTGTPPYIPVGHGTPSERIQKEPCCFETRGGIEAYCLAAARGLAPGGVFVVCEGANPHQRTLDAATAAGLRIFAWRDVIPKEGKPALFTLYAMELANKDAEITHAERGDDFLVRDRASKPSPDYLEARRVMGMPPMKIENQKNRSDAGE